MLRKSGLRNGVVIGSVTGRRTGVMTGGLLRRSECHNDESSCLLCGVVGSNLKQQGEWKAKLMTDNGSQSSACE